MAPRKDLMRIIRSDESFSATLGFGSAEAPPPGGVDAPKAASTATPAQAVENARANPPPPDAEPELHPVAEPPVARAGPPATGRGMVIYVAVSLTEAQAIRAERWAAAASCSVHLLMRRTAQAMRKDLFDLWAVSGVDKVEEQRGSRGRHPTSITLTLHPDLAAAFSAQLDPLAVIGLGRAISPAFRMRFEAAFDAAAEKAGF